MRILNSEELKRYSRQIILPEIGLLGQQKLAAARVLVIGAGGLGCPILQYLAAAGIGNLGIADDDLIELSNLHRQILYSTADLGKFKAVTAREKLLLLNPAIEITCFTDRFTAENAVAICEGFDLVIDGSDNFETRYLCSDTCTTLGKALVFGSIFRFEGQLAVFNYRGGPTYRDLFPEPPAPGQAPNCSETGVLGVLPGILGSYMAGEAIKIICGIGEVLSGKLMRINILDHSTQVFSFGRQIETADRPAEAISGNHALTPAGYQNLLQSSAAEIYLIDVREEYEFEESNQGGVNIPLYDLPAKIGELPLNKILVFSCLSGQRSKIALELVRPSYSGELYSLGTGSHS